MRGTIEYIDTGENVVAPLFEKGDKVKLGEQIGVVESTKYNGMIVIVNWDTDKLGKQWLAGSLEPIE